MQSILKRRDVVSWCLYDWANSVFITSIVVAILPTGGYRAFFNDPAHVRLNLGLFAWNSSADAIWGYINAAYMILAAVAAPVLGAIADAGRSKKKFLGFFAIIGAGLTIALAWPTRGQWVLASVIFAAANFLWTAANPFYDGFLPELTDKGEEMDAISSAGYGWGYLGGGLMLLLNVMMIQKPAAFGLPGVSAAVRWSFVLVGIWWAAFTVPLLLWVKESPRVGPAAAAVGRSWRFVSAGFRQLRTTLRKVGRLPEMGKFLVAFLLYNTGIGTLFVIAGLYATSTTANGGLGLEQGDVIAALLMVQFVGLPAAFAFIWLARKVGTKTSIFLGIAVYAGVVIYAYWLRPGMAVSLPGGRVLTTRGLFWLLAVLVALVQGGTQAMSRSLFGTMVPAERSAEFYGFFSIFNKVGSFAGPLVFAVARDVTHSMRIGILFLIVFFLLGFAMLLTVRVKRGQEQARAFAA
ncbi:MAG: hypothetical protein BIFFINMI_02105 [Phycisphaerae bacterium]|nr:hypothetical protein [Phycisphaerae bacterium]